MKTSNRQLAEAMLSELSAGKSMAGLSKSLAAYLIAERRSKDADAIIRSFNDLLERRRGQVDVQLTSAHKLNTNLQQELASLLAPGAKRVTINETIEPAVLGGVLVESADQRLDLTVRRQIQRLKGVQA